MGNPLNKGADPNSYQTPHRHQKKAGTADLLALCSSDKVYGKDNKVVRRLRGKRTAFMKHILAVKVEKVFIHELSGGRGFFRAEFENGDHYESDFVDYYKMLDFVKSVDSLKGAEKYVEDKLVGVV